MDASARGFHTQLLLIAAQRRPAGTLPTDEAQWRRWVGLPESGAKENEGEDPVAALMQQSLGPHSLALALQAPSGQWRSHQGRWLDYVWLSRWKPMLMEAWAVVDAELVAEYPHLRGAEGQYFCPMAMALGQVAPALPTRDVAAAGQAPESPSPPVKKTRTSRKKSTVPSDPLLVQLLALSPDIGPLNDPRHVLKCFQTVPLPEQRQTLWDLAVRVLAQSPEEARQVRSYLGKLITQYGEQSVAKAVGEVSVKAIAPADAKAYLMGVLRTEAAGGNAKVQEALERRGQVAL